MLWVNANLKSPSYLLTRTQHCGRFFTKNELQKKYSFCRKNMKMGKLDWVLDKLKQQCYKKFIAVVKFECLPVGMSETSTFTGLAETIWISILNAYITCLKRYRLFGIVTSVSAVPKFKWGTNDKVHFNQLQKLCSASDYCRKLTEYLIN